MNMKKPEPDYWAPMFPGEFFHVFNRGNNRENIFYNSGNPKYFLAKYAKYLHTVVDTYTYCLLPNHFHLLVRVKTAEEMLAAIQQLTSPQGLKTLDASNQQDPEILKARAYTLDSILARGDSYAISDFVSTLVSKQFRLLFMAYAKAINKQEGRIGSLFQKNFKRLRIESDFHLNSVVLYIHANPQLHGLCDNFRDWNDGSYQAFLCDNPSKLRRFDVLKWFGGKQGFIDQHDKYIDWKTVNDWLIED
jgi:putative transposase